MGITYRQKLDGKERTFERRHVLEIEATYQGSRVQFLLQEEDTLEVKDDAFYLTFKNTDPDLPDSEAFLYKKDLFAISIHHRWQAYLLEEDVVPEEALRLAEADLADQPVQIGTESAENQGQ